MEDDEIRDLAANDAALSMVQTDIIVALLSLLMRRRVLSRNDVEEELLGHLERLGGERVQQPADGAGEAPEMTLLTTTAKRMKRILFPTETAKEANAEEEPPVAE